MPALHNFLLFMAAALLLNVTPGPDMLYVATRSAAEGFRAGVASSLGITTGCIVHLSAVAFGLTSLLRAMPVAYELVQLLGAGYLMFLGLRALLTRETARAAVIDTGNGSAVFRQGVLTNVLNPKVALFFLAFLPQFVEPGAAHPTRQIVVLGLCFMTSATLVNIAVGYGASNLSDRIRIGTRSSATMRRVSGAVFIALGLRVALARR